MRGFKATVGEGFDEAVKVLENYLHLNSIPSKNEIQNSLHCRIDGDIVVN